MPRYLRIQLVLGIAVFLVGTAIGAVGMSQSLDTLSGTGEADLARAIGESIANVEKWHRIGSYVSSAGILYAVGILTIWFIGAPEKGPSSQVSKEA